jgi:glycerol-3-phosphate acyltransferase PlsY
MPIILLVAIVSYLLGSIPFGYLLVRIFRGEDVRRSGSGNIGATNVSRKSPVLGLITLLLDALKGSAAVTVAILWSHGELGCADSQTWHPNQVWSPMASVVAVRAATAALFAILGHMFPVWLKFRGGKGVATASGSFLIIAPKAILLAAGVFVIVLLIFRYVSLASIMAVMLFPSLAWQMHEYGGAPMALLCMGFASLFIIARHHENIGRLIAGTETRFRSRRA